MAARRNGGAGVSVESGNGEPRIVVGSVRERDRRTIADERNDGLRRVGNADSIFALFAVPTHHRGGIGERWFIGAADDGNVFVVEGCESRFE
jgi:hypothetical protein